MGQQGQQEEVVPADQTWRQRRLFEPQDVLSVLYPCFTSSLARVGMSARSMLRILTAAGYLFLKTAHGFFIGADDDGLLLKKKSSIMYS
jgi:hypothetical protein